MLELHVWGSESKVAPFCPESIAATLYVKLSIADHNQYRIVPSLETGYLDAILYRFPFLKDTAPNRTTTVVEGYAGITRHLKKLGVEYDLDKWLSDAEHQDGEYDDRLLNTGLASFMTDKLNLLGYYNHFLNKKNYSNASTALFKHCLRFPLQYYVPLRLADSIATRCETIGVAPMSSSQGYQSSEFAQEKIERMESELNLPPLGTLHTERRKNMLKELQLLKESSANFRVLNLVQQYLQKVDINGTVTKESGVGGENDGSGKVAKFIFGDQISSADVLLIANVLSAIVDPNLPDQFLGNFLQLKYPKLIALSSECLPLLDLSR